MSDSTKGVNPIYNRRELIKKVAKLGLSATALEMFTSQPVLAVTRSTPYYTFRLNNFQANETRSGSIFGTAKDSDIAALGLYIGDYQFPTQTSSSVDLGSGDEWSDGLEFTAVPVLPNTSVRFNYQIVNAGHIDHALLVQSLGYSAQALSAILAPTGVWALITAGSIEGFKQIINLLTANCDGYVAGDQVQVTRSLLQQWTNEITTYEETRNYPGIDSPHGCGGNSNYSVNWSVSPVQGQDNWRWCNSCQGLFFAGDPAGYGACPARFNQFSFIKPQPHTLNGSGNYCLLPNINGYATQGNWRWCKYCEGLFYAGKNPNSSFGIGVCPARVYSTFELGHVYNGSANYHLIANRSSAGQNNWRWCKNCQGLFYDGGSTHGVCPAGSTDTIHNPHVLTGSGDYVLIGV